MFKFKFGQNNVSSQNIYITSNPYNFSAQKFSYYQQIIIVFQSSLCP